jgi:hypothetical protein
LSCSKGDTGPAGPQGPAGAAGTNGAAGATILSGNGAPATTLGNVGDFYLDLSSFMFYGPKTSAGWGTGVLIKGAPGNANVFTDTFTVTNTSWGYYSFFYVPLQSGVASFDTAKFANRNEPHLTQDILDQGMVVGSFEANPDLNPNSWDALPYSYQVSGTGYSINYAYQSSLNTIHLYFFFHFITGTKPPELKIYSIPTHRFKFVFIAGKVGSQIRSLIRSRGKTIVQ